MVLEILLRLLLLLNIILFHHHGCEAEEVVVNMDGTVATGGPLPMPYGVDVSWPMQNPELFLEKTPLSEQQIAYESYMVGCYGAYEEEICNDSEQERIEMTFHQPPYQKNFTSAGYAKIKVSVTINIWTVAVAVCSFFSVRLAGSFIFSYSFSFSRLLKRSSPSCKRFGKRNKIVEPKKPGIKVSCDTL